MADPYRILGVEKDATDEEVKTAYRNLAKKYHPDAYENNPLADLAAQKMGEIDEAYDRIMEMRRGSGIDASATQESYQAGGESNVHENYAQIRQLITAGNLSEAENMLNRVPSDMRSGEWNFLMGSVNYSKGWLDQASRFFAEAVRIEPNNQEYRAAYNRMMWQQGGGTNGNPYAGGANTGCSACDMCSALLCADCCCNCMGGGMRC